MKLFKLLTLAAMSFGLAACGSQPAPAPVENKFPVKDVIAFYEEGGLDVVVPSYESKANDFEVDTEDPKAFVVYANSSSHDEMAAYKESLIKDSWVLISEVEGDYLLSYGETAARVSLVDFSEYVGIAFSIYSEPVEGMSAEEAMSEFSVYFGATAIEVESGVYGFYQAWMYDEEENNPAALMEYVDMVFEYVLTEFSASGEWVDDDGANLRYFINLVGTQFEIYVYEDNVWVKDGYIVDKDTEGAEEVHVVCVEAYSYTVNE